MIDSRKKLEAWLKGRPREYAQVIAARSALRTLPNALGSRYADQWVARHALTLFRATAMSWIARNFPTHDVNNSYSVVNAARAAYADAIYATNRSATRAIFAAADILAKADIRGSDIAIDAAVDAAINAAEAAGFVAAPFSGDEEARAAFWSNLSADCDWLDKSKDTIAAVSTLTGERLWARNIPKKWQETWRDARTRLVALDPSYRVWIDWYDRRIRGDLASFDIATDTDRIEDKKIIAMLADATNRDFWGKGAIHVNTTLQRWINEGIIRTAPFPEQDPAAITYGVNDRGQLDRLPASDQKHLRDIPDQQFLYGRIREAAFDLLGEGQRLGVPFSRALNRFAVAMPEDFAAALALPLWAEGIILRRLYRAHRIAFESKELSSDQLEPVIAEGLGGLLDLYNHFAFGDDGLRAKDETTIPPQERASAASEAEAAAPLAAALLQTPEVATDIVIDDIMAEADARPDGSPYDDQARDHTNRNWRNRVAAILTGLRKTIVVAAKETAKGVYSGLINMGMTDAATGTHTLAALGLLVATNAQAFITYVSTAFPTYNLGPLIEQIARLFS